MNLQLPYGGRLQSQLLDFPHYTRPAWISGDGRFLEVLIGGNHAEVAKWRRAKAVEKTRRNRPDMVVSGFIRNDLADRE